jgi:hypothetical protein
VNSRTGGLALYVNGRPLPRLVWDDEALLNVAELYLGMNPEFPADDLVRQGTPIINRSEIEILVHFPLAAGAEPIAVQRH